MFVIARYGEAAIPYKENKEANHQILMVFQNLLKNFNKIMKHKVEYNIAVPHNIIGIKQKYDDPLEMSLYNDKFNVTKCAIIYGTAKEVFRYR